jgi:primosomal protein N' (replication factor Y) (superfamily II helicase)
MRDMRYAEVSVNSPAAQRRSFSYSIPPFLRVEVGQVVRVPFGSRTLEGVVIELPDVPAFEQTKDIEDVVEDKPLLSPSGVALARWISDYYMAPLFDAISLLLPPGFERQSLTYLTFTEKAAGPETASLSEEHRQLIEVLKQNDRTAQKKIDKLFGEKKSRTLTSQLIGRGFIRRTYELGTSRIKPKTEEFFSLARPLSNELLQQLHLSAKQQALVQAMAEQNVPLDRTTLRNLPGGDNPTIRALVEKGIIHVDTQTIIRDPMARQHTTPDKPLTLTADQETAFREIKASMENGGKQKFLIHGVTGSGKTEVYLQALSEAIRLGKQAIVLVPEISLTPQTIDRFAARFPNRVAVLHSHLSPGEQFDEWHRIKNGEFDVVVGPRSALFAPQPDLGLIIIDEEHEWTYKQTEKSPRYHARDAAIKLAELTGATVVLGSATPDVGTYERARRGEFRLLSLPQRVTPTENAPLPQVAVIDLKQELKAGADSLFSRPLKQAVAEAVASREQVILFLNRRGASTFVQCRKCGLVLKCRRCEVSLTYHSINNMLVCHQCNYRRRMPDACPRCGSLRIKFLGAGTQKLEEETKYIFPNAKILRWDSDATRAKGAHEDIMKTFATHEADILIGTQMVTKGLDIPLVTVVGVINADIALNFPHFLATERTYQLLSQVAGRAGRGERGGHVFFQTYNPDHFAIQAASKHDYRIFFEKEIIFRRELGYPPFARLASLVYSHSNEKSCQAEAERFGKQLDQEIKSRGIAGLSIIGPAPAYIYRLRGRYRWQIILRGANPTELMHEVPLPRGWSLDIDPVGLV